MVSGSEMISFEKHTKTQLSCIESFYKKGVFDRINPFIRLY